MLRAHSLCRTTLASLTLIVMADAARAQWVQFSNQTSTRLVAAANIGTSNPDEKEFAVADVDLDGDLDLICVYKEPFTTTGRRRNALFLNEGTAQGHAIDGVLVDRTVEFIPQFLDLTNDRDVVIVDVDGDKLPDIVTSTTLSGAQPKAISHPRVYINQGFDGGGDWLGYLFDDVNRIPTMPQEPRFCSVAAGDVDGDGDQDLYFGDYDQGPYSRPADLNDRLLINNGLGYFTDETALRMTSEMVLSAFGMATAIADMNGDGVLDIVKDTALAFPQRISISYNDPDNEGFFDVFDVVYDNAPYHVSVGDLNNDNKLDLVVTDDGSDRYLLNQGNAPNGSANFIERVFVGTNSEFGGDSYIVDLNNDTFNDVFITDVDIDIPGCTRTSKMYRNLGNLPDVTLQDQGTGGIAGSDMVGLHDVAIFDINGDGWKDIVLGRCVGIRVYINQPPGGLLFTYPQGLPFFARPNLATPFQVQVNGLGGVTPQAGTGVLFVSVNNGPFTSSNMVHLGGNLYQGLLPAAECTDRLRFYVRAQSTTGGLFTDPPNAPTGYYSAVSAVSTTITLRDEIEGDVSGWSITSDPSLISGAWEQADPNGTVFAGDQAAPEIDATQGAENVKAFVTDDGPPGGDPAANDVDGGPTYLVSPVIDLNGTDATISYSRWFFCNDAGTSEADVLTVEVSNNDGASWTPVESVTGTGGQWTSHSFLVGAFVNPTSTVRVRFGASDEPNNSVTEAGIDNFQVESLVCTYCEESEDCDDGNACTNEFCNHGVCEITNNSNPCDDGNPCTENDQCASGGCVGTPIPGCQPCSTLAECDDGNVCTDDACTGSVCTHDFNTIACDDGNACTIGDACSAGACAGSLIPGCQPCTDDGDCDDSLYCNGAETCSANTCQPGTAPCDIGQPCDELTDTCTLLLQPKLGEPLNGLTPDELNRFTIGQQKFDKVFLETEGLGPVFNQSSCGQCHNTGGPGGAGSITVVRFGSIDKGGFDPLDYLGGSLLQSQAISAECTESVPVEANVTAIRLTTPIFGAGLVEAIVDSDILFNVTNRPPGVSGIAHMVTALEEPPGSAERVGRFGWKAQVATVLSFSGDALLNEMGITNRLVPDENAPNGDAGLLAQCDEVADPEDGPDGQGYDFIDRVTDFQRFLAAPPQTPKSGMTGETLFAQIGCTSCHKPQFVTGDALESAIANRAIQPYSDFLLHNMGTLSDSITQGGAPGTHMRTMPLWGVRVRDPLLHDGNIGGGSFEERILQAIVRHGDPGSTAAFAATAFQNLTSQQQDAIIAFLDSLGRAEFDHDGNNVIDDEDFRDFRACYVASGMNAYTPDDPCAISDIDQDGDVDGDDFEMFLLAYDGVPADCDGNSVIDLRQIIEGTAFDCNDNVVLDGCDILGGASADCQANLVPDECEPNGDTDLLIDDCDNCAVVGNPYQHDIDTDGDGDLCDGCPSLSSGGCVAAGSGAAELTASAGGSLSTPDQSLEIDVPAGALSADTTVSSTRLTVSPGTEDLLLNDGRSWTGAILGQYDVRTAGATLLQQVALTFEQDVTALQDGQRQAVSVFIWSVPDQAYVEQTAACTVLESPPGTFVSSCELSTGAFTVFSVIAPDCFAFGDLDHTGVIDVDDIACVLNGFAELGCPNADVMPCEPDGNGTVDVDDIAAVLDAFAGMPACADVCGQ